MQEESFDNYSILTFYFASTMMDEKLACFLTGGGVRVMNNFNFHHYTNIVFGKGTEAQVGALTAQLGKKVLLHYGGGSIKKSGLYDRVVASLKAAGVEYVELGGVKPNPRLSLVHEAVELCRREGVDCILAVGGGSVIDSAKAISIGVPYEGDVWDFYCQKATPASALKIGVVLTIPAAGSETNLGSVITNEATAVKLNLNYAGYKPQFAILNPELTYSLPLDQTAYGVCDILAHIMERYFTPTEGVDFSDRVLEGAMRSVINIGPQVLEHPTDYTARANIMWAGCLGHSGILGSDRIGDWGSHRLTHQIGAIYDIAHGAALAIAFPAWMKYVYKEHLPRFVQFAQRVFDVDLAVDNPEEIAHEGIRRLEAFFKRLGLSTRFSDVGIDSMNFESIAEFIAPTGNLKKLSKEDVVAIYHLAL